MSDTELPYDEILSRLVGDTSFWGETHLDNRTMRNLESVEQIMWWSLLIFTDKLKLENRCEWSAQKQFERAKDICEEVLNTVKSALDELGEE